VLADALVAHVVNADPPFDAILVTGDVATSGDQRDLRAAKDFLDRLVATKTPVLVIPGNHDRYSNSALLWPGGRTFDGVIRSSQGGPLKILHERAAVLDVFEDTTGQRLAMVGADFTLPETSMIRGRGLWLGHGLASEEVVQRLDHVTRAVRDEVPGVAVAWIIHFPPHVSGRGLDLHEKDRLLAAIETLQPSFVVMGHTHKFRHVVIHGVPMVVCGSTTAFENGRPDKNSACVLEWTATAPLQVRNQMWDGVGFV
jgi:DNA repair exonuclease SbcCD nuclease subunit